MANLYYAQPLLPEIANHFHTSNSRVALVITASQLGYVLGLIFVLPLGDLIKRKGLIVAGLFAGAVALTLIAVVKTLLLFEVLSLIIGISSVSAQVIVPLAADLSAPERSGKTVGTVTSGILIGILLARTFSGVTANAFGLTGVFVIAAVLLASMALVLFRMLPNVAPRQKDDGLAEILKSTFSIFLEHRALQIRAAYGFTSFCAFTLLWTSLSFFLASPSYGYSPSSIGLFGLLGVAGATAARITGSAADSGKVRLATGTGGALIVISFVAMHFFGTTLWLLGLGIILLDAGAMIVHVSNQSVIYKVVPSARSRINSSYMTLYFLGGGVGSAIAGVAWQQGGWGATTLAGSIAGLIIIAILLVDSTVLRRNEMDGK